METNKLIGEIACSLPWLKRSVCMTFARMPSRVAVATRTFVAVLLALARLFEVLLQVNRDSSAEQLVQPEILFKTHPDEGGRKVEFDKLQKAKETWDEARKGATPQGGRPSTTAGPCLTGSQWWARWSQSLRWAQAKIWGSLGM